MKLHAQNFIAHLCKGTIMRVNQMELQCYEMSENPVLYWNIVSPFSRAVKCLTDIGRVPCKLVEVDLFKLEQKKPEFASLNPMKQVPLLVHKDFKLSESSAIMIYLWQTFEMIPRSFYGSTPQERATVNQYLSWCQSYFSPSIGEYGILKKEIGIRQGKPIPEDLLKVAEGKLNESLTMLDNLLIDKEYLANNTFTLCDLLVYFMLNSIMYYGRDHYQYSNISRWFKNIYAIPQVKSITHKWFPIAQRMAQFLQSLPVSPAPSL